MARVTEERGISGQLTFGGTLSVNSTDLNNNGFDMGNATGYSLWAAYSESGLVLTGWHAEAALGWSSGDADISRGRGIENVMLATGQTRLETMAARYGFEHQDWLLTPSISLAHFEIRRGAYVETGSDFNATYESLSNSRTIMSLEIKVGRGVSNIGTISMGAGLEHDLSADMVTLVGSSEILGMTGFATSSALKRRETRGFASVEYTHDLGDNRGLMSALRISQSAFGNTPQISVSMGF